MIQIKTLAEEHFQCRCRVRYSINSVVATVEVYTDASPADFRRARRDFYLLMRRAGYTNVAKYLSIERAENGQLHPPSHS